MQGAKKCLRPDPAMLLETHRGPDASTKSDRPSPRRLGLLVSIAACSLSSVACCLARCPAPRRAPDVGTEADDRARAWRLRRLVQLERCGARSPEKRLPLCASESTARTHGDSTTSSRFLPASRGRLCWSDTLRWCGDHQSRRPEPERQALVYIAAYALDQGET